MSSELETARVAEPRSILRSSSMSDLAWASTSDDAMSSEGDEVRRRARVLRVLRPRFCWLASVRLGAARTRGFRNRNLIG
jgi:hypothetical protein